MCLKNVPGFQDYDDEEEEDEEEEEEEDEDEEEDDGEMGEEGEDSNEGSGDGNEPYEGNDAEVGLPTTHEFSVPSPTLHPRPEHRVNPSHSLPFPLTHSFFPHRLISPSLAFYPCVVTLSAFKPVLTLAVCFLLSPPLHIFSRMSQCLQRGSEWSFTCNLCVSLED